MATNSADMKFFQGVQTPEVPPAPSGEIYDFGAPTEDGDDEEAPFKVPKPREYPTSDDDWQSRIRTALDAELRKVAEDIGFSSFSLITTFHNEFDSFLDWLRPFVANDADLAAWQSSVPEGILKGNELDASTLQDQSTGDKFGAVIPVGGTAKLNPFDSKGLEQVFALSKVWAAQRFGIPQELLNPAPKRRGGGGGGGRKYPTEQEIRNQFDMQQLEDSIKDMGRAYLVDDVKGARAMADAYVNEIVRTKGQKELDFQTFVLERFRKTPRWQQLYRAKPHGMTEQQYLQPYLQSAARILGGGKEFDDVVAGGAALGSTGAEFAGRLQNTREGMTQPGFIGALEEQMRGISSLMRG